MIEVWFIFTTPRIPYTIRKAYGRKRVFAQGCRTADTLEAARQHLPHWRGLTRYKLRSNDNDIVELWIPWSSMLALKTKRP